MARPVFPAIGSRAGHRLAAALLTGTLAWASVPANADVWGYIDAQGVAHFASEKLDARYELFFRAPVPLADDGADAPAAASVPSAVLPEPGERASRLLAYFDVSANYKAVRHLMRQAAAEFGVDYELLKAVIVTESGFNPRAVSPKGAIGLMQVIPPTGERYGVRADARGTVEQKLADPATNIRAGTRYLADLMRMFPGRLDLVLASYNAGEGAVLRAGRRIPDYPETQNYVRTVLQIHSVLKPPALMAQRLRESTGRVQVQFAPPPGRASMPPGLGPAAAAAPALPLVRAGTFGPVALTDAPTAAPGRTALD